MTSQAHNLARRVKASASSQPTKGGSSTCTLSSSPTQRSNVPAFKRPNAPTFHSSFVPRKGNSKKRWRNKCWTPFFCRKWRPHSSKRAQLNANYFDLFQNNSPGETTRPRSQFPRRLSSVAGPPPVHPLSCNTCPASFSVRVNLPSFQTSNRQSPAVHRQLSTFNFQFSTRQTFN